MAEDQDRVSVVFEDPTMASVYKTLLPIYKKVLDGEMTLPEYNAIKEVEFAKL